MRIRLRFLYHSKAEYPFLEGQICTKKKNNIIKKLLFKRKCFNHKVCTRKGSGVGRARHLSALTPGVKNLWPNIILRDFKIKAPLAFSN